MELVVDKMKMQLATSRQLLHAQTQVELHGNRESVEARPEIGDGGRNFNLEISPPRFAELALSGRRQC